MAFFMFIVLKNNKLGSLSDCRNLVSDEKHHIFYASSIFVYSSVLLESYRQISLSPVVSPMNLIASTCHERTSVQVTVL